MRFTFPPYAFCYQLPVSSEQILDWLVISYQG